MKNPAPAVVILAAGRGTRMRSEIPKALHPICGVPMVGALLGSAKALKASKTVVVAGYGIAEVREWVGAAAAVVEQKNRLGSGHAALMAEPALRGHKGPVVVLYCDTPLLTPETLARLLATNRESNADGTLLSVRRPDPKGYGRVVRGGSGSVEAIVEELEATDAQRRIEEVNVGAYVFDGPKFFAALKKVGKSPEKKEYYLTDAVGILAREGRIEAVVTEDFDETAGVNTLADLARLESILQARICRSWMDRGVRIRRPETVAIDADVAIGEGTVIEPFTSIEQGSTIGKNCSIGPFARIRGGSRIGDGATIGNFVEVVRSKVGAGSAAKHLSYLGDAEIGTGVNVGAGTITANYDGKNKHVTRIRDGARLGSGTVLIAPVTIGRNAVTAAGAVVTKGKNVRDGETVAGVPATPLKTQKGKR